MKKVSVLSHEIIPVIKDLLASDQDVLLTVSGTSMRPFYHHQKTVVKLVKIKTTLKRFDVVLYEDTDQYKLHRILRIKDDVIIICGDGLKEIETIKPTQIFGKVVEHHNKHKIILESQRSYRFKVWIWAYLRPFRRILLKLFGG